MRARPLLVCAALALASCLQEGDPAQVKVNVVFPSTALAIASDEVKLVVYDDGAPDACQRIYLKHITNQTDLPPVIAAPPPVAVCDLAEGRSASVTVPLGNHALLAVAQHAKQDLLVGCAAVAISYNGGEATVVMALPENTAVPPLSSCVSVKDACEKRCQ